MNNTNNIRDENKTTNFHYKTALTIDEKVMRTVKYQPVNEQTLKNIEFSDVEISPFYSDEILCGPQTEGASPRRKNSPTKFSKQKISFSSINTILNNVSNKPRSLNIYCAILKSRVTNTPSTGIYRYEKKCGGLQFVKKFSNNSICENLGFNKNKMQPNCCLIYVASLDPLSNHHQVNEYKNILIKVGMTTQCVDKKINAVGMSDRLISAFNDYEVINFLGLEHIYHIPIILQYIGKS